MDCGNRSASNKADLAKDFHGYQQSPSGKMGHFMQAMPHLGLIEKFNAAGKLPVDKLSAVDGFPRSRSIQERQAKPRAPILPTTSFFDEIIRRYDDVTCD